MNRARRNGRWCGRSICEAKACSKVALTAAALLLIASGELAAEAAPCPTDVLRSSPLDPAVFVEISRDHKAVVKRGLKPPLWEVMPGRGELRIDFDREAMKCLWDSNTRAELSVLGSVSGSDGASRKIEIPGYSVFGDRIQFVKLDMAAAADLVDQLYQASRFARRIQSSDWSATTAGLRAQRELLERQRAALDAYVEDTERILRRVYSQALTFTLDTPSLVDAAAELGRAQERLERAGGGADVAQQARVESFFSDLSSERPAIEVWLERLLDEERDEYLDILSALVDRGGGVVRAVATDIGEQLERWRDEDLEIGEQDALREHLVHVAHRLVEIEDDLYRKYRGLGKGRHQQISARRQFVAEAPEGFQWGNLQPPGQFLRSALAVHETECQSEVETSENGQPDGGQSLAERRLQAIAGTLRELMGSERYDKREGVILARFEEHVDRALMRSAELTQEIERLDRKLLEAEQKRCQYNRIEKDEVVQQKLKDLTLGLRAILLVELIDRLIDRIPPSVIDLGALGLKEGDDLRLSVSLLPPVPGSTLPPAQETFAFRIQPRGWRGPAPLVRDTLAFARARGGEYEPSPGVAAIWNFYGKGRRARAPMRVLAPGFGISATFLDFEASSEMDGNADESVEVGIGLTVTLFDNLLSFTWGQNLQAKQEGSRDFFSIGLSFTEVIQKFTKQK